MAKKYVSLYYVVEYLDNGEINTTMYDDKNDALIHIHNFELSRSNVLDVCGLDEVDLICNSDNRDENGEVVYSLEHRHLHYNLDEIIND